jgi:AcrR family transcriptional regulator
MIKTLPAGVEGSTRDRLLAAGIRLFAERGFRDTTVGDIESEAGLQPRRGALYHHFPTKQALLEAAVQTHLVAIEAGLPGMDELPGLDVRTEAMLMGRWLLAELDAERYLVRLLEQDGDRVPDIRDLVRERIIDAGHRRVEALVRRRLGEGSTLDTEVLATLIIGPLANHRRVSWTYGSPPLGVDDDRLLTTWVESLVTLLGAMGAAARKEQRAKATAGRRGGTRSSMSR